MAFDTSSGLPWSDVNLGTGAATGPAWAPHSSLSEAGTLALEFGMLDRLTGAFLPVVVFRSECFLLVQTRDAWQPCKVLCVTGSMHVALLITLSHMSATSSP